MKRYLVAAAMLSMALVASGHAFSQSASTVEDLSIRAVHAPPMLGIHWARGFEPNFRAKEAGHFRPRRPPSSPNMTYQGGKIMPAAVAASIFWGGELRYLQRRRNHRSG